MSAGDVKFIGWTGGATPYQELPPRISYEPLRVTSVRYFGGYTPTYITNNYVVKKMVRELILFAKDKDAFIASIDGFLSSSVTINYLDTDGSVKTKSLGDGWQLLTIDESPVQTGFTKLTLTYQKTEAKAIAFPNIHLQKQITFSCAGGVCEIKYGEHVLESMDSGTGSCSTGLDFLIERVEQNVDLSKTTITEETVLEYQSAVYYRLSSVCNGVVFDVLEIVGSELPQYTRPWKKITETLESSTLNETYPTYDLAVYEVEKWHQEQLWGDDQVNQAIDGLRQKYHDKALTKYKIEIKQELNPGITGSRVSATIRRYASITPTYTIPANAPSVSVGWKTSGNIIQLVFSGGFWTSERTLQPFSKVWKEYDLTGLT